MLKRIPKDQVELGMFIHAMDGNWFRHPFWRGRFLVDTAEKLERLRISDIDTVVIDLAQGRDVASPPQSEPAPRSHAPRAAAGHAVPSGPARRATDIAPEIARAERLARAAGKAVNRMFIEARLGRKIAASNVEPVIDDIYASIQRNIYAFNGLLRCQSDQLDLYRHALSVSALMVALARRMNLPGETARAAGMVGLLMDVGLAELCAETGIADYRDLPPDLAQGHVLAGHTVLRAAGDIPADVIAGCLHHHERIDGSGHPARLSGDAISLLGQMAGLCDVYDCLVVGAPGRAPCDPASALEQLDTMRGAFAPALVEHLVETVGVYPIGSFVELDSNRLAMVVDQDDADIALPVLQVFARLEPGEGGSRRAVPIRAELVALGHCYGQDGIVGVADLDAYDLPSRETLREDLLRRAMRASTR